MSGETAERPGEEEIYFRAIEERFIRLRGAPLLLSPADWRVARGWQEKGVPLALVLASLDEVFARRAARRAKGRIQSLRYCAPAVEEAWEEHRELVAAGRREEAPPLAVAARLEKLAAALPDSLPGRAPVTERLLALAGTPAEVEGALAELDRQVLAAARADLAAAAEREIQADVERVLSGLARRLGGPEEASQREALFRQALRRRLRLPVLSLFSPEANDR